MLRSWDSGEKVLKLIGFDATEDHRTFGDGKGFEICNGPGLPKYGDRYEVLYPLRLWGMDRAACGREITEAGLPLPPKSACFFCPAMKEIEILQLKATEPVLYMLALEMERLFRAGKHFRGDSKWTIKAEHKTTKEKLEWEVTADTKDEARAQARTTLKDVRPYQWKLGLSGAVPGLGRTFQWSQIAA